MSYAEGALKATRPVGALDGMAGSFQASATKAEGLRNRLYSIIERLRGPTPRALGVEKGPDTPPRQPPINERLASAATSLNAAHQEIDSLLDDLDALV